MEQPKQGLAGVNPVPVYASDFGMRNKLITCSSTTRTECIYTPPTFRKFRCLEVSLITVSRLLNREVIMLVNWNALKPAYYSFPTSSKHVEVQVPRTIEIGALELV